MTRACIHDITPRTECPICKNLERIVTQRTIQYATVARMISGTQNRVFEQSVRRLAGLPQNYPDTRLTITDEMRNATRNFIASPRNAPMGDRFRRVMSSALVRAEVNVGGSYSASSSSSNLNSPRSSVGTGSRFTRSGLTVYSRLGTPDSPNSPRSRRARSGTPVSRFAGPQSPGSNASNVERFSPPRKKSKQTLWCLSKTSSETPLFLVMVCVWQTVF